MTYLEALYGSQYAELIKNGKDGQKARMNGNLFLSAFVIMTIIAAFALVNTFSDDFADEISRFFNRIFGHSSGKVIGKILALPILGLIYFIITKTVGKQTKFDNYCAAFLSSPEEEQRKANKKVLIPFFIPLILFFVLAMSSLF